MFLFSANLGNVWATVTPPIVCFVLCEFLMNMNWVNVQLQLLGALAGVELSLMEVGYPVTLGSGVAAAQAHLGKKTPLIKSRI